MDILELIFNSPRKFSRKALQFCLISLVYRSLSVHFEVLGGLGWEGTLGGGGDDSCVFAFCLEYQDD